MKTNAQLHPKLQVAVDRLNKRYSNITVKGYRTSKRSDADPELIISLNLFTDVHPDKAFARLWINDHQHMNADEHIFVAESRLIRNERSPRDEKRTKKVKLITNIVDQFVRPFTFQERADEIVSAGRHKLYYEMRRAEEKASSCWTELLRNDMNKVLDYFENKIPHAMLGEKFCAGVKEYRELRTLSHWVRDNYNGVNGAMQIVAFNVNDRWILNIYGNNENRVEEYDSFEAMPDFVQQKVALLRIAPHNEMLEDIGVKVEANSYFLYGNDLKVLRKSNDSGEESKDASNQTA